MEEEPNIPTLKKWNERVAQEISDNVGLVPAPVICDLCGDRMVENPRQLFPNWPYKRLVTCPRCHHKGQRLL